MARTASEGQDPNQRRFMICTYNISSFIVPLL